VANRHYAKIADVWKHLPLTELLAVERPTRYLESHAGSAQYPLTASPERDYGFAGSLITPRLRQQQRAPPTVAY